MTPDDDVRLAVLEARVAVLEARLAGRHGARDASDAAISWHLATLARSFTTADVVRHAGVDFDLAALLLSCDIDVATKEGKKGAARQLGKLLKRISRSLDGDVIVKQVGETRDGILWRCEFASFPRETNAR